MKKVSICEFKRHLSSLVAEAAGGESILITKHKNPLAKLSAADRDHLIVGSRVGKVTLKPVLKRGSKGRYLAVLLEDRYGAGSR